LIKYGNISISIRILPPAEMVMYGLYMSMYGDLD
jgi:hypothetical protein